MDRDALDRLAPRAVARAERGQSLDLDEIAALAAARGPVLERLLDVASGLRDLGLSEAGRPNRVTLGFQAARGRSPRDGDLLAQGVHPAHPVVPRPLPLLHLRDRPRTPARALSLTR